MSTYEPYDPDAARRRPQPDVPPALPPREPAGWRGPVVPSWAVPSLVCVAIWLMTGAGYFWPMWVILGTGIPVLLARSGGRVCGSQQHRDQTTRRLEG